jgi:hypothetical protein
MVGWSVGLDLVKVSVKHNLWKSVSRNLLELGPTTSNVERQYQAVGFPELPPLPPLLEHKQSIAA